MPIGVLSSYIYKFNKKAINLQPKIINDLSV